MKRASATVLFLCWLGTTYGCSDPQSTNPDLSVMADLGSGGDVDDLASRADLAPSGSNDLATPDPGVPVYHPLPTKNAFWTLHHCEFGLFNATGLVKIGIHGDTVINGKTYHQLYGQVKSKKSNSCDDCDFDWDENEAFYFLSFREENKQVFVVPAKPAGSDPDGTEYLLYDFNIENVGDQVTAYPFFFSPLAAMPNDPSTWGGIASDKPVTYTVKAIKEVKMSDGSTRKTYLFDDTIIESWIEGIGSSNGFASFYHIFDIKDATMGFSADGVHLTDIPNSGVVSAGGCSVDPFSYELTGGVP